MVAALATAFVALSGCPRVDVPEDRAPDTPTAVAPQDTLPMMTDADRELLRRARGRGYLDHPGWADEQHLTFLVNGQLVLGPRARIEPDSQLHRHQQATFVNWVPVARIMSDSNYRKLGIRSPNGMNDTNFVLVRRVANRWEGAMVSTADPGTYVPLRVNYQPTPPHGRPPPVARWIFDPLDDGMWVSCGLGCCSVDGVAAGS